MGDPSLGDLELQVLKVVADRQPCTISDAAAVMARRGGYARTTILTVMERLRDKGFVTRRKRAGVYHYSASRPAHAVVQGLIRRFVDRVLDGTPEPFIAYLSDSEDLTDEQVETLREIARSIERRRREEHERADPDAQ